MIFSFLRKYWIVILILTLTSCSNIQVVEIDQDLKRIVKFNSKGEFIKSYFKKFDKETNLWLLANCPNNNVKKLIQKSNKCEFTNVSLNTINIVKERDSSWDSSIPDNKNIEVEQEDGGEEEKKREEEEEEEGGFFEWCGGEICE